MNYSLTVFKLSSIAFVCWCLVPFFVQGQSSFIVVGGDIKGSNGSVAYSVGEFAFVSAVGSNGSLTQGVQQPIVTVTVGLEESNAETTIHIYPNPGIDHVIVQLRQILVPGSSCELLDSNGKVIYSRELNEVETELDITSITSPLFFIRVMIPYRSSKTFKIIKKDHL
jgi:PKD repeat protein